MPTSELWLARLYRSLGLGFVWGSLLIGCGGFVLIVALLVVFGGERAYFLESGIVFLIPIILLVTVLGQYGSKFIVARLEGLRVYAQAMSPDAALPSLSGLYSIRNTVITYAVQMSIVQTVYTTTNLLPSGLSLAESLYVSLPFCYWNLYIGTFSWVWVYSLHYVYRVGKLPLRLKPFTEDTTLGLKPFGRISLLLVGIYLGVFNLILVPQMVLGLSSIGILGLYVGIVTLAFVFLLLPLFPIRQKMIDGRRQVMARIDPRYARAVDTMLVATDTPVSEAVARELMAIDKVQRDARQIHSWPFDTSLVLRLAAVILSVVGIVLARIVQLALHLAA